MEQEKEKNEETFVKKVVQTALERLRHINIILMWSRRKESLNSLKH